MKNRKSFRDYPVKGTVFSQYEKEYFLNRENRLESYPALRDCQEYINSNYETVYQQILDKLMEPANVIMNPADNYISERNSNFDKLDIMLEADSLFEEYRRNNESFNGSRADFIAHLQNNIKKGYEQYEKEISARAQSEQKEFQQNSEESAQA